MFISQKSFFRLTNLLKSFSILFNFIKQTDEKEKVS